MSNPAPSAVQFISKWDYHNASTADENKFKEQASDFPRRHEWQEEDLKAAFKHLQSAVCSSNFPVYDTGPATLAKTALEWILQHIENADAFHDEYVSFLLACIAAGPSLAHIDLMYAVACKRTFQGYLKTLSGTKLTSLLAGLQKKFVNSETLPKDYCEKLTSVLRSHVIQTFSKEQCSQHREAFVRLLMFYQSQVPEADEYMAKLYYSNLCNAIENLMGRDKWKDLESVVLDPKPLCYREQLEAFGKFFKAGKYPAFEKQGDIFKNCLRNILEPILQNKTYFSPYLDDVMKLFCIVAKMPPGKDQEKIMDPFSSFISGLRDKKQLVENKHQLFKKYAPVVTNLILDMPHPDCLGGVIKDLLEYFLKRAGASDDSHTKLWVNFLAAMVTQSDVRFIESSKKFVQNHKKLLKWKDNVEGARVILTNLGSAKIKEVDENSTGSRRWDNNNPDSVGRALADFAKELLKQIKFCKVLGDVQKEVLTIIQDILEEGDSNKLCIAKECSEFIELKDDLSLALPLIDTFERQFKREDYPWDHWAMVGLCIDLLIKVIQAHKDQEQFKPYAPKFVSIFKTAMNRDFYNCDSDSKSVFGYVLMGPLVLLGTLYRNGKNYDDLKPLLGDMVRLLQCEDEEISSSIGNAFTMLTMANAAMFAPHMKEIVEAMLDNEDTTLLSVVQACYKHNPQPVDDVFDQIFDLLGSIEVNYQSSVLMLLKEIAERNPKLFTKDQVDTLFDEYMDSQMTEGTVLQLLQALSLSSSSPLEPHMDKLFAKMSSLIGAAMIPTILVNLAHKNKKLLQPVFDKLIEFVQNCKEDYTYLSCTLNSIRVIGAHDKEILTPHKKLFENLGEKHPNLKDMCKHLVDIIEGRSVEDITEKIGQQQDDINQLDTRVANTENEVKEISVEVDSQGRKIGQLDEDVAKQGGRIDDLEVVVDDTVVKVEEIDKKTLTNAPIWSRDVSLLLNPEAEHDWRLLAQRLGYSPEDIRGWATQHDPCMSLLSEWFATHKTSEATKAVLKTLEEMNRLDAAEIVGRAMQAVENVVEDEPLDYDTPPPIFISYQWGHQPEVRLLRKHLEMAGFESWLDIGQMGGGDKLYAKIDQGIRAAKVVICCVTERYAKSPNCNREVNLAVNLGKPIIPLLLENVAWPPPGSMGPIFGEYLYIRFFQRRKDEETKDDRVWPPLSFKELLMQLSYMKLIPDHSKISKPYEKWWLPPEEVIVVKKKPNSGGDSKEAAAKSGESKDLGDQPEVFISYQWGIQPQVKALYKRMSGLGYHCWMDIHQMGGGDSLYDKIDRGVRGCKVVLSCVTEKYSKSANCRREVSLADALKKPIIPLLLEDTTWPPSGPMSMVFTQLLYIDFKDEKIQQSWSGETFDELLRKIKLHISSDVESSKSDKGRENKPVKPSGPVAPSNPAPPAAVVQDAPAETKQAAAVQDAPAETRQAAAVQDAPAETRQAAVVQDASADTKQRAPGAPRPQSSQARKVTRPYTPKKGGRSKSCTLL